MGLAAYIHSEESAMNQHLRTLKISLIASVIGTLAWYLGLSEMVWPMHPFVAVLLITAVSYYVVGCYWDTTVRGVAEKRPE
jgi:hypothetical protein